MQKIGWWSPHKCFQDKLLPTNFSTISQKVNQNLEWELSAWNQHALLQKSLLFYKTEFLKWSSCFFTFFKISNLFSTVSQVRWKSTNVTIFFMFTENLATSRRLVQNTKVERVKWSAIESFDEHECFGHFLKACDRAIRNFWYRFSKIMPFDYLILN